MYRIKEKLANRSNFGLKRDPSSIKYIVIHYTANDGDSAEANGNYFKNNIVKSSAHYFVDNKNVVNSVPDDYVAYSVGGDHRSSAGGGKYYNKCTNSNSISVELCDNTKDGTIYPSFETIENAILLTKDIMHRYNISHENVIRHFDVNGKLCPAYWIKDSVWKKEFWNYLSEEKDVFKKYYEGDYPSLPPNLRQGSKGAEVQKLQIYLNWYGSSLVVDSIFGKATKNAVIAFQKQEKLSTDGIFGPKSLQKAKTIKR